MFGYGKGSDSYPGSKCKIEINLKVKGMIGMMMDIRKWVLEMTSKDDK